VRFKWILFFLLNVWQEPLGAQIPVPKPDWRSFPPTAYLPDEIQVRLSPAAIRQLPGTNIPLTGNSGIGIPALDSVWHQLGFVSYKKLISISILPSKKGIDPVSTDVLRWIRIKLPAAKLLGPALQMLSSQTQWVEIAEPVYNVELYGTVETPFFEGQWFPDDSLFARQWHYHNEGQTGGTPDADIDLPEAWEIERGHPSVLVGVLDNGIDTTHVDLLASLSPLRGYNFYNNQPELVPGNHGNHTSGTIAARNNNVSWVSGIAGGDGTPESGVRLVSCQIFGVPSGSGGIENAFFWSAQNGVAISSNSWGYTQPGAFNQSVLDAIDYFIENGGGSVLKNGLVIFSGGNGSDYAERWPGAYSKVIGVTATNQDDFRAWYSTYHETLDIAAPGGETNTSSGGQVVNGGRQGVLSTILQAAGGVGYLQGSSMAAPHVSGVAALVASHGRGRLSADDVKSILLTQTDPIDSFLQLSYRNRMGTGRLNAFKALNLTRGLMLQLEVPAPSQFQTKVICSDIEINWVKNKAEDNVMVAVSTEDNRGGLFGVPQGVYAAGDTLLGGGRIIYTGPASTFLFTQTREGQRYYFKIWTTGPDGNYSMGIVPANPVTISSSLASFSATVNCYDYTDLSWQFKSGCLDAKSLVAFNTSNSFGEPSGNYSAGDAIGSAKVVFVGSGNVYRHLLGSTGDSAGLYYRIWPIKAEGTYGEPVSKEVFTPAAIQRAYAKNTGITSVLSIWERQECFTGEVLIAWNTNGQFAQPEGLLNAGDVFPGSSDTVLYRGFSSEWLHAGLLSNQTYYYGVWPVINGEYGLPKFFSAKTRCTGTVLPLPFRDTIGPSSLLGCVLDTIGFRNFTAGPHPQLKVTESNVNPSANPFSGNFMLSFNSFDTRETNEVWLTSPPLSSRGVQSVDVAFKWYEDGSDYNSEFFSKEGITLLWSADYANWDSVITYPRITRYGPDGWKYKQVTLPAAAAGKDVIFVRWVFRSAWGFNCYFDEMAVIPTAPKIADGIFSKAVAQFQSPSGFTHFYDEKEKLLFSVNSGNDTLGHVNDTLDLGVGGNEGVVKIAGSSNYVRNSGGWATLGKYWHIEKWRQPVRPVTLRFYVSDGEWEALKQMAAGSFAPPTALGDSLPLFTYLLGDATRGAANPAAFHTGLLNGFSYGQLGFWQFNRGNIIDSLRYVLSAFVAGWNYVELPISRKGGGGAGAGSSAGNGALDANWLQGSAVRIQKTTEINWTTGYEREWLLMQVERAPLSTGNFQVLGYISPGGWSQSGGNYSFTDAALLPNGTYHYRIRATDIHGREFISPKIAITIEDTKGILIFPNPATGGQLTVFSEEPMEWLRIMDGLGRVVYRANPGTTQFLLNLPSLATGIYFLQVGMPTGVKTQKLWITP